MNKVVLVDLDGVVADFEKEFLNLWRKLYPGLLYIPLEQRKKFYIADDYPGELKDKVQAIYNEKGFIENLPSVDGAIKALHEMRDSGFIVKICTSPLSSNPYSEEEKRIWVRKHLGEVWRREMIITKDKSVINADYLIDDKPEIKTTQAPSWEQIIFDAPYNREVTDKRRINNWSDWKSIIK